MNVSKLSIGTFTPKKGFKTIHVKNPEHKTVETFLTLASGTQKQEALEAQLAAKAAKVRADIQTPSLASHFGPGYFDAFNRITQK